MQQYQVFKFDNENNEKVVFVTSTEDLYYLQYDIFDDLSKTNGENFTVLVDLFLRNGFSFNRFASLKYEGKDKCRTLIVNPRDVSEEIKFKIRNYLITHIEILNNSALMRNTINFVITGKI